MTTNTIITIGRQLGSGGREIGQMLAKDLGIKYYDKELLTAAAKESGMAQELFENHDEKPTNSILYSLVMGIQSGRGAYHRYGDLLNSDAIFRIQSQVIQNLVDEKPCVIVGRCADYVLRENPNAVNVFIHAKEDFKLKRVMDIYKKTEKDALDTMVKTDKRRSNYYNFYTNQVWGDVTNYHIALDSGSIGIENSARLIVDFVKMKRGE